MILVLAAIASASQSLLNTHLNMTVEQRRETDSLSDTPFQSLRLIRARHPVMSATTFSRTPVVASFFFKRHPRWCRIA